MQQLSAEEAKQRLLKEAYLTNAVVEGSLDFTSSELSSLTLEGVEIRGNLTLAGGELDFFNLRHVVVRGMCALSSVRLIGGLDLTQTSLKQLHLNDVEIGGVVDLRGLKTERLVVTEELAEIIHYAAPTTPIVVLRRLLEKEKLELL